MDYEKIIKKAKEMPYSFLFYNEEYEEDFIKNLDKNIIKETERTVFFVDRTEEQPTLFWAGATMEDVAAELDNLKVVLSGGQTLSIKCGEDKHTLGQLDKILPVFIKKGGKVIRHNVGLKTSSLDFQQHFPLVTVPDIEDSHKVLKLAYNCFGEEKFGMDLEELNSYLAEDDKYLFVIKSQDGIAGLAIGSIYSQGKTIFIRGLAVDEAYRGLGYSKQLLSKAFSFAKQKGAANSMLWVDNSNSVAKALYKKFGYFPYGDQEVTVEYTFS